MPASRYPGAFAAPDASLVPTNAASEPKSTTSTSGQSVTSNRRCGLRTSTYAWRRAIARMRSHDRPRGVSVCAGLLLMGLRPPALQRPYDAARKVRAGGSAPGSWVIRLLGRRRLAVAGELQEHAFEVAPAV